jgi:hypothetical protein
LWVRVRFWGNIPKPTGRSIEPSTEHEKHFSSAVRVGFYALAGDRKLTQKRGFPAAQV